MAESRAYPKHPIISVRPRRRHGQKPNSTRPFCAAELEALIDRRGAQTLSAAGPLSESRSWAPAELSHRLRGLLEAIQPILKKHDILLITDEVVHGGFGRLGNG